MTIDSSSLTVGDRVISYCRDGLLAAEYALFDPDDVLVSGVLGFGTRERGYETTAKLARQRLRAAGIGPNLAREAFAALNRGHVRQLARAPSVAAVADRLTACEAFEGGEFRATARAFNGTWLDLRALTAACPLIGVGEVLQVLHLDLLLEEVADDTPVRMLTAAVTAERPSGFRTWKKARFDSARNLPTVLRALPAPGRMGEPARLEEAGSRERLLEGLQARAVASPAARPRLEMLAAELTQARRPAVYLLPKLAEPVDPEATTLPDGLNAARPLPRLGFPGGNQRPEHDACERAKVVELITTPSSVGSPCAVAPLASDSELGVDLAHRAEPWRLAPSMAEPVENLPLPFGASDDLFPNGERPRAPADARVLMTRLARTVGRDYRLAYDTSIVANVTALELVQRHLRRTLDSRATLSSLEAECTRHGALLSEILARSLGAEWIDVSSDDPESWTMQLPSGVRFMPIGRVRYFVQEGQRADDLIAFYLDLESQQEPDAVAV